MGGEEEKVREKERETQRVEAVEERKIKGKEGRGKRNTVGSRSRK